MNEVLQILMTSTLVCMFCGIWWKSYLKNKDFNFHVDTMNTMINSFIRVNSIEYVDFELLDTVGIDEIQKEYIDINITRAVAKEIDKGYDLYHIGVKAGYDTMLHRHNFSDEFFYVLSGRICITDIDGDAKLLNEGEYLYVEHKNFHNVSADIDSDFVVIAKPSLIRRK